MTRIARRPPPLGGTRLRVKVLAGLGRRDQTRGELLAYDCNGANVATLQPILDALRAEGLAETYEARANPRNCRLATYYRLRSPAGPGPGQGQGKGGGR